MARAEPGADSAIRTLSLSLAATGAGLRWSGRRGLELSVVNVFLEGGAVLRFGFRGILDE